MRDEVERFRNERNIPYLLHFTRLENLGSIMKHGLLPRVNADAGEISCVVNDDMRLDNRSEFNCLSISFPNGPMFYRFQQDNPGVNWVILVINPVIMALKNTLFCRHNAADARISGLAAEVLSSIDAFRGLFDEIEGHPTRADQLLKSWDPTDVQAEVLVEGVIEPSYIYAVVYRTKADRDANAHLVGDRKTYVQGRDGFFGTRGYFRQWGIGAK